MPTQKQKNVKLLGVFLFFFIVLVVPKTVFAVPPPSFIFDIGAQMIQAFSFVIVFLSAMLGILYQVVKVRLIKYKFNKFFIALSVVAVLVASVLVAYVYGGYRQKFEYEKWLNRSEEFSQKNREGKDLKGITEEDVLPEENSDGDIDQLKIENSLPRSFNSSLSFVAAVPETLNDSTTLFIKSYYESIANKDYNKAYSLSKKSVSLETFRGWYRNTERVTLDRLTRIDDKKSSLELTLYEGETYVRYGVLMTLALENNIPIKVEKSEVKILGQGTITLKPEKNIQPEPQGYDFYENNKNYNIVLSNNEFKTIIESKRKDYVVLDAREDIEYENGNFPDSTHIRFADLKAGRWIELPQDKFVYVLCWSGIRGQEVAEFLRTKKIVASYLEKGANGWVEFGGKWRGGIKFAEKYSEPRYQRLFSTSDLKKKVEEGVVLVDSREPSKYKAWHIDRSVSIPIMYTPSIRLEEIFRQVPSGSTVITVCDGYVNCFDAKITAVELEKRGHKFLGRYNSPWEYKKESEK